MCGAFSFGGLGAWAQSLSRLSTLPLRGATDTVRLPESLSGRCSFGGGVNRALPWPSCRRLIHMGGVALRQRIRCVTTCDNAVNRLCRQTCLLQATAGVGWPLSWPLDDCPEPADCGAAPRRPRFVRHEYQVRVALLEEGLGRKAFEDASRMVGRKRTCFGNLSSGRDVRLHNVKWRARAPRSMAAACSRSMFNSYRISSSSRSSVSSNVPSAAATSQASA